MKEEIINNLTTKDLNNLEQLEKLTNLAINKLTAILNKDQNK